MASKCISFGCIKHCIAILSKQALFLVIQAFEALILDFLSKMLVRNSFVQCFQFVEIHAEGVENQWRIGFCISLKRASFEKTQCYPCLQHFCVFVLYANASHAGFGHFRPSRKLRFGSRKWSGAVQNSVSTLVMQCRHAVHGA